MDIPFQNNGIIRNISSLEDLVFLVKLVGRDGDRVIMFELVRHACPSEKALEFMQRASYLSPFKMTSDKGRANLTSSASSQPVRPALQYAFTGRIVAAKATLTRE
jgi:hypothetical protein